MIKDNILRRQQQFDVNMLLDKLLTQIEDHYKLNPFSIVDGTSMRCSLCIKDEGIARKGSKSMSISFLKVLLCF